MAKFKVRGLDQFKRDLRKLQRKAKQIGGVRNVPLDELLTPTFLNRHTNFASVEDMFKKSGYNVETMEELERIPEEEWNVFIATNTLFSSWQDMLTAAMSEQVKQHFES